MQFVSPDEFLQKSGFENIPELFNPSGFSLPFAPLILSKAAKLVEKKEKVKFHTLELVFVDEHEIEQINREYLNKEYITDIISFRYDDRNNSAIEATLYCCAPRIAEQAAEFSTELEEEFLRVYIHGLLHTAGYRDDTKEQKKTMSELEDHYLQYFDEH